jgi:hypothetical protein
VGEAPPVEALLPPVIVLEPPFGPELPPLFVPPELLVPPEPAGAPPLDLPPAVVGPVPVSPLQALVRKKHEIRPGMADSATCIRGISPGSGRAPLKSRFPSSRGSEIEQGQ